MGQYDVRNHIGRTAFNQTVIRNDCQDDIKYSFDPIDEESGSENSVDQHG